MISKKDLCLSTVLSDRQQRPLQPIGRHHWQLEEGPGRPLGCLIEGSTQHLTLEEVDFDRSSCNFLSAKVQMQQVLTIFLPHFFRLVTAAQTLVFSRVTDVKPCSASDEYWLNLVLMPCQRPVKW